MSMRHIPLLALNPHGFFALTAKKLGFTVFFADRRHIVGTKLAVVLFRRFIQAPCNIFRLSGGLCLEMGFLLYELILWDLHR
jgi:hypothetical protein